MTNKKDDIDIVNSIQKKFQTSMIGSLARIEDYLGFMWGHNKDLISIEQSDNRQIWNELREEILDYSNYQMRSALNDLKKFVANLPDGNAKFTTTFSADLSERINEE